MYIGLNVSSKPGVRLKHFRSYSHVRDKFITREVHEYIPFVESWLQKIQEHYPAEAGIDVSILSEAGRHV